MIGTLPEALREPEKRWAASAGENLSFNRLERIVTRKSHGLFLPPGHMFSLFPTCRSFALYVLSATCCLGQ